MVYQTDFYGVKMVEKYFDHDGGWGLDRMVYQFSGY
jgi:hypothetical protein